MRLPPGQPPLPHVGPPGSPGIGSMEGNVGARATSASVSNLSCEDGDFDPNTGDCTSSKVSFNPRLIGPDDTSVPGVTSEDVEWDQIYLKVGRENWWNTWAIGGRQRITLDDHRFIGNVGWRQNEQTFDSVRVTTNLIPDLKLDYSYIWEVQRIFGSKSSRSASYGSPPSGVPQHWALRRLRRSCFSIQGWNCLKSFCSRAAFQASKASGMRRKAQRPQYRATDPSRQRFTHQSVHPEVCV